MYFHSVSVLVILQESQYKSYRDQLRQSVIDFKLICDRINPSIRPLFEGHVKQAYQNFLPGINKISWNSTNIGSVFTLCNGSCNVFLLDFDLFY